MMRERGMSIIYRRPLSSEMEIVEAAEMKPLRHVCVDESSQVMPKQLMGIPGSPMPANALLRATVGHPSAKVSLPC